MDLIYMVLIILSVYTLLDGIDTILQNKEIEEIKNRLNLLEKEIKENRTKPA
jgi:hypothetical protein